VAQEIKSERLDLKSASVIIETVLAQGRLCTRSTSFPGKNFLLWEKFFFFKYTCDFLSGFFLDFSNQNQNTRGTSDAY